MTVWIYGKPDKNNKNVIKALFPNRNKVAEKDLIMGKNNNGMRRSRQRKKLPLPQISDICWHKNSLVGILSTNMVCGIIQRICSGQLLKIAAVCMKSLYLNMIMQKPLCTCPNNKNLFLMSLANNHDCLMLADDENELTVTEQKMLSDMKDVRVSHS